MLSKFAARMTLAGILAAGAAMLAPTLARAAGDPPKPAQQCSEFKKGSPGWKRCMGQELQELKDDEAIYSYGYWLAKTGDHAEALAVLATARDQNDPRVLTMTGFALRKLGRVEEALPRYAAALAIDPNLTSTRQYLGEAYLRLGAPDKARDQLAQIGARCGTGCEDYRLLAQAIADAQG